MPTNQPTLHTSSVSLSLVEGQRTLFFENGEWGGDVTWVYFSRWNFPWRRVADDRVGTRDGLYQGCSFPPHSWWSDLIYDMELINQSSAQQPWYCANGSIETDIHETSVGASAPHSCTIFRWCIQECNCGLSQCRFAGSPACASKEANQCGSCHYLASVGNQVITVCQCSVKLHSMVGRRSLAGMSSTTDVHVQFSFASRLFRWNVDDTVLTSLNLSRHCFSQGEMMVISRVNVSSFVLQSWWTLTKAMSSEYPYFFELISG